jgi:Protein of unknown function (DUF3987)
VTSDTWVIRVGDFRRPRRSWRLIPTDETQHANPGRSRRIVLRPGFEVSPGSWYGIVGEPGTGKSPGQKYALRAVTPLQDEAWERYRQRLDDWEALPKEERGEKPVPEHYFITDSTGEALWAALASSLGVAQVEDELRRRLKALDAYRQAGDRQVMLGLWANAPVKIVRRTSAPVYFPFPVAPLECAAGKQCKQCTEDPPNRCTQLCA